MERLKDAHFDPASLQADGRELLRAAEPYVLPPALKRNVRVRLVEGAPRRGLFSLQRATLPRAALAVCVLFVAAVSLAAVGRSLWRPPAASVASARNTWTASALNALAVSGARARLSQNDAASPSDVGIEPTRPSEPPKRMGDRHADAQRETATPSEASLVYETAHALRSEGDPARAARVLNDYFKRYPHGALAEEAQALAIEVAVARGDAHAKVLASRYLSHYPEGHFRAKAERALQPATP